MAWYKKLGRAFGAGVSGLASGYTTGQQLGLQREAGSRAEAASERAEQESIRRRTNEVVANWQRIFQQGGGTEQAFKTVSAQAEREIFSLPPEEQEYARQQLAGMRSGSVAQTLGDITGATAAAGAVELGAADVGSAEAIGRASGRVSSAAEQARATAGMYAGATGKTGAALGGLEESIAGLSGKQQALANITQGLRIIGDPNASVEDVAQARKRIRSAYVESLGLDDAMAETSMNRLTRDRKAMMNRWFIETYLPLADDPDMILEAAIGLGSTAQKLAEAKIQRIERERAGDITEAESRMLTEAGNMIGLARMSASRKRMDDARSYMAQAIEMYGQAGTSGKTSAQMWSENGDRILLDAAKLDQDEAKKDLRMMQGPDLIELGESYGIYASRASIELRSDILRAMFPETVEKSEDELLAEASKKILVAAKVSRRNLRDAIDILVAQGPDISDAVKSDLRRLGWELDIDNETLRKIDESVLEPTGPRAGRGGMFAPGERGGRFRRSGETRAGFGAATRSFAESLLGE